MIYIYTNNDNTITTDSWTGYIPESLEIYLDELNIGEFTNDSTDVRYMEFTIPEAVITDLQKKEYTIYYYDHSALIKSELVLIKDPNPLEIKSINNTNTIKYYEKQ
jgi:hypothetical protein